MMMTSNELRVDVFSKWVALVLLIISLTTSLFAVGYNYRKLEGLEPRLTALEAGESVHDAKIATDVEWIKKELLQNKSDHTEILHRLERIQITLAAKK